VDGIKCSAPGSKPDPDNIRGTLEILVFDPGGIAIRTKRKNVPKKHKRA
jgi:hypothetical protein